VKLKLPVQAVVDRSALFDMYALSFDAMRFGAAPSDPGPFAPTVDPRQRACARFGGHGCARGARYF